MCDPIEKQDKPALSRILARIYNMTQNHVNSLYATFYSQFRKIGFNGTIYSGNRPSRIDMWRSLLNCNRQVNNQGQWLKVQTASNLAKKKKHTRIINDKL